MLLGAVASCFCSVPFFPVFRPGPFPEDSKSMRRFQFKHRSSPSPTSRSLHWSPQRERRNEGTERNYTATRDAWLHSMSVRSIAAFAKVIAVWSPRLQRGSLAVRRFAEDRPFAAFCRREVAVHSQKDVRHYRLLASPEGTPIARRQKDVHLQEVKNVAANRTLLKKSLRT